MGALPPLRQCNARASVDSSSTEMTTGQENTSLRYGDVLGARDGWIARPGCHIALDDEHLPVSTGNDGTHQRPHNCCDVPIIRLGSATIRNRSLR